jgi:glycosyltransferase involved in cell wall biosynthesis
MGRVPLDDGTRSRGDALPGGETVVSHWMGSAPGDGAEPSVSVIVPVWNGRDVIGPCIDALHSQDYRGRFEVIVVDNGSDDGTPGIVSRYPAVRFATEPSPGSYAARNLGLSLARGDVVAFTDADCVPDPSWLSHGVGALRRSPDIGVVAGEVAVTATTPDNIAELHDVHFAFRQQHLARRNRCVTANWFSPRDVIQAVGPFDATLKSGGDWALAEKIAAAGYRVVHEPGAVVAHPARASVAELVRKRRRVAGGVIDKAPSFRGFLRVQRALLADTLRKLAVTWRIPDLRAGQKVRLSLLLVRMWLAFLLESVRLRLGGRSSRS